MGMCFAPDCKHHSESHTCSFFRFPQDNLIKKRWIKLIRRQDRSPGPTATVCSCHFKDGMKANGPTIFIHNEDKIFHFQSPPKKKRQRKQRVPTPPPEPGLKLADDVQAVEIECVGNVDLHIEPSTLPSLSEPKPNFEPSVSAENYFLRQELENLKAEKKYLCNSFSFKHIEDKDSLINHYTGMPNEFIFTCLFELFEDMNLNYYLNWKVETIPKKDQLLLTLMKLRLNLTHTDLSVRFNCSQATITNIILTWVNALHEVVFCRLMHTIPSRFKNQTCMPQCFNNFSNCRLILDCTEVFSEIPKSMDKQNLTYSHYKHRNTLKALLGVAPNGIATYASCLYPGSTSDKQIVRHSEVLQQMVPGDLILADKGFLLSDMLPDGVTLNIPPFLTTPQFTPDQVIQTKNIARARIHVERAISRVKDYSILNLIPHSLMPSATKVWQVCVALTNFQCPLIKEVALLYNVDD